MIHALAILVLLAGPLSAQAPAATLARARAAYRHTDTYQAQFTQIISNEIFGEDTTRGRIYLEKPERFAMRFVEPAGDRIVVDGEWFWLYTPSTTPDQVIRTGIPTEGPATPNLFSQFVDRPAERYRASAAGSGVVEGKPVDKVRLVPRDPDMPFREAVLYVGAADGLIRGMELVEETGQRRTLTFEDIRINDPIPPAEISFDPPKGIRIVVP